MFKCSFREILSPYQTNWKMCLYVIGFFKNFGLPKKQQQKIQQTNKNQSKNVILLKVLYYLKNNTSVIKT